jgi:hypothetical protein
MIPLARTAAASLPAPAAPADPTELLDEELERVVGGLRRAWFGGVGGLGGLGDGRAETPRWGPSVSPPRVTGDA